MARPVRKGIFAHRRRFARRVLSIIRLAVRRDKGPPPMPQPARPEDRFPAEVLNSRTP